MKQTLPLFSAGAVVLGTLLLAIPQAQAAGALAGAQIQNTAQVNYTVGTTPATQNSNTVTLTVNEIVDVVTTLQSGDVPVTPGAANAVVVFRVTNTGNGPETFRLTLSSALPGDDFDPTPASPAIYVDNDNSGTVTPGDTVYSQGSNDPVLAPDAFVNLLVLNNIGAPLTTGNRGFTRLTAEALTAVNSAGALGNPGTVIAGQGASGTDAIVGTTGADSFATGTYLVSDIALAAVKAATVSDPFGGNRPMPGATIVYQVLITATGSGTASGALFSDPVPANTTYVAGSLRLNGNVLTDASDADAGQFQTTPTARVTVALGNLTQAAGVQTVQFSVRIN